MFISAEKICCLHATKCKIFEPITLFTAESLARVHTIRQIRATQQNRTKYGNIKLPEKVDGFSGYHKSCYTYYTAIRDKQKKSIAF